MRAYLISNFILLLLGLYQIVQGWIQWIDNLRTEFLLRHITGTFDNPGPFSGFIIVILPIAFYWVLQIVPYVYGKKDKASNSNTVLLLGSVASVYIVGSVWVLWIAQSRSALLAGLVGCFLVLWKEYSARQYISRFFKERTLQSIVYSCVVLAIIIVGGRYLYFVKKDSADGRLLIWKIALSTVPNNPYTGAGNGHFGGVYGDAQADYFGSGKGTEHEKIIADAPEYGFNEYIQIAVEYGLVGLIGFLTIIGFALWKVGRSKTRGAGAILGSLMAVLVFACFSYPFRVFYLCLVSVQIVIMAGCMPLQKPDKVWRFNFVYVLLIVCGLFSVGFSFGRMDGNIFHAQKYWIKVRPYYDNGDFEQIVDKYAKLYPFLKNNAAFLFEYGQCLSKTGEYEDSNRILKEGNMLSADPMFYNIMGKNYEALGLYGYAKDSFVSAMNRTPNRLYPMYLLMEMYFRIGEVEKGIEIAIGIVGKTPKVVSRNTKEIQEHAKNKLLEIRHLNTVSQ